MIRLNTDIEADLGFTGSNQPNTREDQAQLLDPVASPDVASNPIQQARNSFEDSKVYNILALSVPIMKIFMAIGTLIPGDYACFSTKHMWLVCMIGHDIFHSYIIWLKFQAAAAMSRLGLTSSALQNANNNNNNANNENNPNARDLQMNELGGGHRDNVPQQADQDDSVAIPIQPSESENSYRSLQTLEIMRKKAHAQKLNKLCTYLWMFLFLFWLEMDAIQEMGPCDSKKINDTIMSFIVLGWLWLLNPIVICLGGCMCLPVFIILVLVFRKRNQTPATRNEIRNLPVKDYTPDLPGDNECAICIANYVEGDKIIQLECSAMHHFHEECLKSWLKINGQCPTCRARIGGESR